MPLASVVVTGRGCGPGVHGRWVWQQLEAAELVGADAGLQAHLDALREQGIEVLDAGGDPDAVTVGGPLVWMCSSPQRAAELAARRPGVTVLPAPADPVGAHVLELVTVMDRLRSPGGCPWDAQQTHASLSPYAIEEAHELADAIAGGDPHEIADELGDLLLQVVFHARVAQEAGAQAFDLDDVADRIVAKLRRRHPHVFADVVASTPAQVEANWEAIKAGEHPQRRGILDGVPRSMAPLERAAKAASRLARGGQAELWEALVARADGPGADLLRAVAATLLSGHDPSAALAGQLRRLAEQVREQTASEPLGDAPAGHDPALNAGGVTA